MRTLKKVLALTVVLATLLSISAFAAFSDEESIDESFVDAVNLLGALNVMTGDTEGTFRPNDTISRAEAAKMIYVIRNGGVDDQAAGWTGMSTFSDVTPGVWFEGYVNYCASLGIIAGIGGGKFNPSGAVTGVELAKMLLVVADYRPDIEGYTGAGWNLNVIRDAQTVGMFEGYTLAYSAAATRQQAAQLFSNAILETQMAVYIGDTRVNDIATIGSAATIGGRFFKLVTATGELTQVPHVTLDTTVSGKADLGVNDNTAEVKLVDSDGKADPRSFVFDVDAALLSQEVEVIYRESGDKTGLDSKDTVYDVIATGTSDVYETTMDAITLALTDNTKAVDKDTNPITIKFDGYNSGRARAIDGKLPVVTNLYNVTVIKDNTAKDNDGKYKVKDADVLALKSAAPVRVIDTDGDGTVDIAYVTAPIYGTVSSYNADRYDFSTNALFDGKKISSGRDEDDFALFTIEDDLKKEDVIRIDVDVLSGEVKYTVSLVDPVVGTLSRVYEDDNKMTVDGSSYSFFGGQFDGKNVTLTAKEYSSDLGEDLTLYTDGKYVISATKGSGQALGSNFAYVQNYNENVTSSDGMTTVTKVQLVLADGTTKVFDYADQTNNTDNIFYDESDITWADVIGRVVEYKANGSKVTFYKEPTATSASIAARYGEDGKYEFNSATGLFNKQSGTSTVGSLKVDDNSVFFLPEYKVDGDGLKQGNIESVTVIKGSELKGEPTITGIEANTDLFMTLVSSLKSGIRTVAYGVLDEGSSVSATGTYAYTTSDSYTELNDDNETVTRVDAILSDGDGDEVTLTLSTGTAVANKVYKVTANADGTYELDQIKTNATIKLEGVLGVVGNTVSTTNGIYNITDDTIIFGVDMDNNVVELGGTIGEAALDSDDKELPNMLFEEDGTDEHNLTIVYVENYGDSVADLIKYTEDEKISDIELTVPAPQVGQNVSDVKANVATAGVKVDSITWQQADDNTGNNSGNATTGTAGKFYQATVTLSADTGYKLPDATVNVKVNGQPLSNQAVTNGTVTVSTAWMAVADATIGTISGLTGLPSELVYAADANALPSTLSMTNTKANASLTWTDSGTSTTAASITAGNTYSTVATFEPAAGYKFDADALKALELKAEDFNGWTVEVDAATTETSLVLNISRVADKAKIAEFGLKVTGTITANTDKPATVLTFAVGDDDATNVGSSDISSLSWRQDGSAGAATDFQGTFPYTATATFTIASGMTTNMEWADSVSISDVDDSGVTDNATLSLSYSAVVDKVESGTVTVTITIAQ